MPVNDLLAKSPGAKPAVLPLNLIGAEWTVGDGSVTREIRNPADQKDVVAAVKEASLAQVDAACNAAAKAFPAWAATPAPDRARVLFNYHDLLSKHFDEIARLLVKENGKLISEARGSVRRGIDVVEYATGIPQQIMGKTHPNVSRNVDSYDLCEPLGVCVGIPPFNFPAMIPSIKSGEHDHQNRTGPEAVKAEKINIRQQHAEDDAAGKNAHGNFRQDICHQRDDGKHGARGRGETPL